MRYVETTLPLIRAHDREQGIALLGERGTGSFRLHLMLDGPDGMSRGSRLLTVKQARELIDALVGAMVEATAQK